jgi:hypothetical protein
MRQSVHIKQLDHMISDFHSVDELLNMFMKFDTEVYK